MRVPQLFLLAAGGKKSQPKKKRLGWFGLPMVTIYTCRKALSEITSFNWACAVLSSLFLAGAQVPGLNIGGPQDVKSTLSFETECQPWQIGRPQEPSLAGTNVGEKFRGLGSEPQATQSSRQ